MERATRRRPNRCARAESWTFRKAAALALPVILAIPHAAGAQAQDPDPFGVWNLQMRSLSDRPTRGVRPALLRVEEVAGELRAEITSLRDEFVPVQEIRYERGRMFVRYGVFDYTLDIDGDHLSGTVATPAGSQDVVGRRQEEGVLLYASQIEDFVTTRAGVVGHRSELTPPPGTDAPGDWVRNRIESVHDLALVVRGNIVIPFANAEEFAERLLALAGREVAVTGVWVGEAIRIEAIEAEAEGPHDH